MHTITMERPEWVMQSAKNIGLLSDDIKIKIIKKQPTEKQKNLKNELERMFLEHFAELFKLIKGKLVFSSTIPSLGGSGSSLKKPERLAYQSYEDAITRKPQLADVTDKEVYKWLKEYGTSEEYDLPNF